MENPWFRDNSASCPSSVVARWGSPIWEWCLLRDLSMARLSFVHLAIRGPTAVLAAGARNGDFRHNDTISVFADSDLAEVSAVTSCLYPPMKTIELCTINPKKLSPKIAEAKSGHVWNIEALMSSRRLWRPTAKSCRQLRNKWPDLIIAASKK